MQPFTSLYTHNRTRSKVFATTNNDDSMTQQSDAAECDINIIMKRYGGSGQLPQVLDQPLYGDFTEALDYRDMLERVRAADEAFATIPAQIRERFNNDPAKFIEFANNKDNLDELRKLGLAVPEPEPAKEPEPMRVIITNPPEQKT